MLWNNTVCKTSYGISTPIPAFLGRGSSQDWTGLDCLFVTVPTTAHYSTRNCNSLIKARYLQLCLYNPVQCVTFSVTNLQTAESRRVVELIPVGRGVTMRPPEIKHFCRNFCRFSQCLVISFRYHIISHHIS